MKAVIWRVTGPEAISLPACGGLAFVMFFSNHNSSGVDSGENFWAVNFAWGVSLAIAFTLLWVGRTFALHREDKIVRRILSTLLVFTVAYISRALIFDAVIFNLGVTNQPDVWYRLAASLPTFGFGMVLFAYIVSLAREFSRNINHLNAMSSEINVLNATAIERVAAHRTEVLEFITSKLKRDLSLARSEVPDVALERMREMVEDVVRPISRQLTATLPDIEPPKRLEFRRILWSTAFRSVLDENPFRSIWYGLWTASAAFAISIARLPVTESLIYVFLVGIAGSVFLQLVRLGWPLVEHSSRIVRAMYFIPASVLVGLGVNFMARFYPPVAPSQQNLLFAYGFISIGIAWLIALVTSLRRVVIHTNSEIEDATRELREIHVQINTQLREQRLAIGRVLHGPVQERILVAAFRLHDAISAGIDDEGLVNELSAPIELAIDEVSQAQQYSVNIVDMISELSALWDGLIEIRYKISDGALEMLRGSSASRLSVAEIVREACTNAIRHGSATQIFVRISVLDTATGFDLSVRNNGTPLEGGILSGAGSMILNELTLEWSRHSDTEGTELRAILPLVASR